MNTNYSNSPTQTTIRTATRIMTLLALLPLASLLSSPSYADNLVWTGAADSSTWDNSTVANWYDTDKAYATNFTAGDNVTFDDSSANILINVADTVQPGSVTVSADSADYTFAGGGDISGAASLTKSGASTLTIDSANDYSGPTTISGGTLQLSYGGTIGTGDVTNNATLSLSAFSGTYVLPNNISGTGILTNGSGSTLVLSGTNTFTGNVYNGTLALTTGLSRSILVISNSTHALDGTSQVILSGGNASTLQMFAPDTNHSLSIPASVGLTMLVGNGTANRAVVTANASVNGNTNLCTWNGPITIKGDGTANEVIQFNANSASLIFNGDITASAADNYAGQVGFVGPPTTNNNIGILNGHFLLNTNADFFENNVTGTSGNYTFGSWTINSTGNTCGAIWILGGILIVGVDNAMPMNSPWIFANGTETATLDLNGHNQQIAGLVNHASAGGAAIITNSSSTLSTLTYSNGVGYFVISSTEGAYASGFRTATFSNFTGNIVGNLGLTVAGGTMNLQASNTYSGNTIITNGATLKLSGSGSIGNSTNIVVAGGATLDTTGSTFSLGVGQTLANSGGGTAVVNSLNTGAGTVSLTYNGSTPPLTTTGGTLTLGSNTVFNVNNTGPALGNGSYTIISSTGGSVAGTAPASVTVGGGGLVAGQTASLQINGGELDLTVAAGVNTNPTNIVFSAAGNQLTLSWPANHTGWQLQAQTNSLAVGINTNWVNVSGSTATNQMVIPINPANAAVFYRLVYPPQ
jgi:autotransporter-associated beta strand protein